jgi:hypothetical protein
MPHILGMTNTLVIDHFPQLQELELLVDWSRWKPVGILSSITSTRLRKITFPASPVRNWDIILQDKDVQDSVDEQLCGLVARLYRAGYRHTLEVEYQLTEVQELYQRNLAEFLPKFRDQGFVTIVHPVPLSDRSPFFSTPS